MFKGVAVSDMLMDDEHSLWIASLDQGLLQVPNQNITVFPIAGTGSKGICKLGFWENQLVGGSLEGSLLTWKQGNSTVLIPSQEKKEVSFLQTENGKLWFGTNNLMRYDGKKLETLSPNPGTKQLFPLNANYLLAAGSDGLSLVSTAKGHELPDWLKPYAKEINTKKTYFARFHNLRSWSVWANDSLQTLFCAGKNGLIRYKKGKEELMQFEGEPVYASSLDGNRKQVIIGTHNQGVLMYSLGNEELNQVKALSTLFENSSVYLVKWQDPYWILVGAKSVVVWNPQTQQQTELSRESGLLSGRVYDALIKDKHLLLAGSSGLFSYPIASLKDNYGKARFQVKSINGVAYEPGKAIEIGLNRQLNLVVDKIGFRQRDQISLQYRLNEGALITLHPSEQSLSINSLPYGESILYLRAINKLNQKTAEEIRIALIVATPIYLQVWFLSCSLILSLGFGIFMWQFRLNQLKKKNAELLEKEQLNHALKSSMLASIKSQMNPHFLFNALNTIQSFILQNDRMNANFYLGKFSDLMRKILGMSTRDTIQLEEELEALKLYLELENMRFNGSLIYEIDLPNEEILELEIPSMIIQPYVENAIKHGLLHSQKERRLQIRFSLEKENVLKVEVEDNGIGRQAAEQIKSRLFKGSFQSFSTEANKRRLELLNEQLATHIGVEYIDKAEHQQAQGTLVRLFIPFS
ncbi:MAG: histidine kinase [Bacteroidia bacterium]|nr:histidine kinase [Bacteroidia bacterium]